MPVGPPSSRPAVSDLDGRFSAVTACLPQHHVDSASYRALPQHRLDRPYHRAHKGGTLMARMLCERCSSSCKRAQHILHLEVAAFLLRHGRGVAHNVADRLLKSPHLVSERPKMICQHFRGSPTPPQGWRVFWVEELRRGWTLEAVHTGRKGHFGDVRAARLYREACVSACRPGALPRGRQRGCSSGQRACLCR